jgi:hypothetical protein
LDCGASCRDSFTVIFQLNAPPVVCGYDSTIFACGNQIVLVGNRYDE